jgi:ferric-dicitrate binding protein FerR (iron transport regulator)
MERLPWEILEKYYNNSISENEKVSLNEWIDENEEHRLLFDEITDMVNAGFPFPGSFNENTPEVWNELQQRLTHKRYIRMPAAKLYSYAAAVIIPLFVAAGLLGFFFRTIAPGDQWVTYTTVYSHGGQKTEVTLPDNSKVWLNANSSLKYASTFDKKHRSVLLVGEAFFDVTHDPENLFVVNTSTALKVNVYGTTFNVKAYADEDVIETTLVKGKITIEGVAIKGSKSKEIVIEPNQTFKYYKSSTEVAPNNVNTGSAATEPATEMKTRQKTLEVAAVELVPHVDVTPITSWKEGRLVFKDEDFESLAVKLERWYNVEITFEDPSIKSIRFTGTFEKENINQVLNYMQVTTSIEYTMKLNNITIRNHKKP